MRPIPWAPLHNNPDNPNNNNDHNPVPDGSLPELDLARLAVAKAQKRLAFAQGDAKRVQGLAAIGVLVVVVRRRPVLASSRDPLRRGGLGLRGLVGPLLSRERAPGL